MVASLSSIVLLLSAIHFSDAYWLMGANNNLVTERLDPVVVPGAVSPHVHTVVGGSNFGPIVTTAGLRNSQCTSLPIAEDKSNYWFPSLYFEWKNGSFSSVDVGVVIYYLFSDTSGVTTAFPDDFRMVSGTPTLRSYNASSYAQQAVTFLCLDFNGVSSRHNELPTGQCPSGVRAQINFPSCWDGKNTDSPDHKSHVSFLSGGPDSGTCKDPQFPVTLPRIFIEGYWSTTPWYAHLSEAKNPNQPFTFSNGDPTGYGYHADFINGWQSGVLQKAVDQCHCNPYGDFTCCSNAGIFTKADQTTCTITPQVNENVLGTLSALPGNNPVTSGPGAAPEPTETNPPSILCNSTVNVSPRRKRDGLRMRARFIQRKSGTWLR